MSSEGEERCKIFVPEQGRHSTAQGKDARSFEEQEAYVEEAVEK